jgi:D-lactate dehydrogenase
MKKGVYIVNTARGELVDTSALVGGLKDEILAGFGADVLEDEKILKDEKNFLTNGKMITEEKIMLDLNHELIKMPNVIITPHIAFFTKEALANIMNTTIENIKAFISGNPINLVK